MNFPKYNLLPMKKNNYCIAYIFLIVPFIYSGALAQTTVPLNDSIPQHIFTHYEIESLKDETGKYTLTDILTPVINQRFQPTGLQTPTINKLNVTHWYRIRIGHNRSTVQQWILEFFDQTIDDITVYAPDGKNHFITTRMGEKYPFAEREYHHKNPTFNLNTQLKGDYVYYIRIKSSRPVDVIIALRSVNWFIHYAVDEYFLFGIFYGMVLIFSLYNLMMFIIMKNRQYLYYVLYNISIAMYEMCTDGVAYQYLWPSSPQWNQYAYGIALYGASIFALLFIKDFLSIKYRSPRLNKVLYLAIGVRTAFFFACFFINHQWFNYKYVELISLLTVVVCSIYSLRKGYKPAMFVVVGYFLLLAGFLVKALLTFHIHVLPYGPVTHYLLSVCFIMEMFFVSMAIGDKVAQLKKKREIVQKRMINEMRENAVLNEELNQERDKAQQLVIDQMKYNAELKDALNKELEIKVEERTREVRERSLIIEEQNEELRMANELLQQQEQEIAQINVMLENDNDLLKTNVEAIAKARIMSADVGFDEFSKIYPDNDSCFRFLSELKWSKGFSCNKCATTTFYSGHLPFSRRCTKCGYEESVTTNTIFQNIRIPINKAFYMVFLVYSSKGKISSHKLSEIVGIRQSTCWAYSSKIKKVMEERKKVLKNAGQKGWSELVLDLN
jgi:hypothetical protein